MKERRRPRVPLLEKGRKMRLGIIGVGTIGEIFTERLAKEKHEISAYDVRAERVKELAKTHGFKTEKSNTDVVEASEVVVVAVKPQTFPTIAEELKRSPFSGRLFVSVLAGIPTAKYEDSLPGVKVVRIMPNLAIRIGKGVIGMARGKHVSEEQETRAEELLRPLGMVERVAEAKMDAVTAVSGSGAGYMFAIIEALAEAGVRVGLDYAQSLRMVAQTMAGSAEMLLAMKKHPAELKNRVTSPGGTTIEGLFVMEKGGFSGILMDAVAAAYRRAKELGSPAR